MHETDRYFKTLSQLCNLPTAPYHEEYVAAFVRQWAEDPGRRRFISWDTDQWGNLYLRYRRRPHCRRILVLEAHMDHPGFVVTGVRRDGSLSAEFFGGVKPSCFAQAQVNIWKAQHPAGGAVLENGRPVGHWIPTRVLSVKPQRGGKPLRCILAATGEKVRRGEIGMWNLPDAAVSGNLLTARVCDDLAGVAVGLAVLDRLMATRVGANVTVLLTRAEEVGFAGAIAAAKDRRFAEPCAIIGIETSKALPHSPQGEGPIIRVGDRTTIFSPALTRFVHMTAAGLADDQPNLRYQRQLMDGGTCDTTAFGAFGLDAAAVCLALGNYHNMRQNTTPVGRAIPKASRHIASETIDLRDFAALVDILAEVCKRFEKYSPDDRSLRRRFLEKFSQLRTNLTAKDTKDDNDKPRKTRNIIHENQRIVNRG